MMNDATDKQKEAERILLTLISDMDATPIIASIKPKWLHLILDGSKTAEVRTTFPSRHTHGLDGFLRGEPVVLFYESSPVCRITAAARLMSYEYVRTSEYGERDESKTGVSKEAFIAYAGKYGGAWIWNLFDVMRFPAQMPLSLVGLGRPPMSWQYVRSIDYRQLKEDKQ